MENSNTMIIILSGVIAFVVTIFIGMNAHTKVAFVDDSRPPTSFGLSESLKGWRAPCGCGD